MQVMSDFSPLHISEYGCCGVSPSSNTDCTLRTLRIIGAATFAAGAAGATTVSGVAAVVVTVVVVPDAHADVTVVVIVGMVKRGVYARTFFVRTLCLSQNEIVPPLAHASEKPFVTCSRNILTKINMHSIPSG